MGFDRTARKSGDGILRGKLVTGRIDGCRCKTESVYSRTNFIVSKQNNGRSRGNAVTFSFISLRPVRFANVFISRFTNVLGQVR